MIIEMIMKVKEKWCTENGDDDDYIILYIT